MVGPSSYQEMSEALLGGGPFRLVGSESTAPYFHAPFDGIPLSTRGLAGIVEHDVDDQVVVVRAGTRVADLQAALGEQGQCLPLGPSGPFDLQDSTVGGAVSMNLPHTLEGPCGTWRDWVLGMRVVRADGTIAKCGSKAVKSVAGYDAQRLFIGARGTLGVIVEVTLRTFPLRALPVAKPERRGQVERTPLVIQRVLATDFAIAVGALEDAYAADPTTATLWYNLEPGQEPRRFSSDWIIRTEGVISRDPTQAQFMARAKSILDPHGVLPPLRVFGL